MNEDLNQIMQKLNTLENTFKQHTHNGIDSRPAASVIDFPVEVILTDADGGSINSGDATTDAVISNIRIRLGQLITALENAGVINT